MPFPPSSAQAFTLVEMSVVLIIVGLLTMSVFPALTALRKDAAGRATDANLATLLRASAAYVQANGCLPCPTPLALSSWAALGRVRGDASASPLACGACTAPEGIAPFVSLGLPAAMAKDGYGRWITMRVDPALTIAFGVVPPTSPCLASDPAPCTLAGASQKGLCRAGLSKAGRLTVSLPSNGSASAAILFVSHGANGYGAATLDSRDIANSGTRLPFPSTSHPSCANGYEACNASETTSFADVPQTLGPASATTFDDHLLYLDRNALVSLFGNGACQTSW